MILRKISMASDHYYNKSGRGGEPSHRGGGRLAWIVWAQEIWEGCFYGGGGTCSSLCRIQMPESGEEVFSGGEGIVSSIRNALYGDCLKEYWAHE